MPYKDKEKQRAFQRDFVARRRSEWMAGKSCAVCGSTEDLEIDHIDGSLKTEHRIWSWAKARREHELAKCQVLCKIHHREKTTGNDNARSFMVLRMAIIFHKCRCKKCREAHRLGCLVKRDAWRFTQTVKSKTG